MQLTLPSPTLSTTAQPLAAGDGAGTLLAALTDVLQAATAQEAAQRLAARLVAANLGQAAAVALTEPGAPRRLKLLACTEAATLDEGNPMLQALTAAMDECHQQQCSVCVPAMPSQNGQLDLAHTQLARHPGAAGVWSIPLADAETVFGVMTLLHTRAEPPTEAQLRHLEHLSSFIGPALALKARVQAAGSRLAAAQVAVRRRFGAAYKRNIALLVGALIGLGLVPLPYQVVTPARLQGKLERALVAPQDGYIGKALVKPGDTVVEGQPLAELEVEGTLLDHTRVLAELAQAENAFGEALGKRERAQIAIQQARVEQAKARLALVQRDLAKSRLTAPFSGQVLSGDLSRSVGAVVKRGELLLTLAPQAGYRLMLWVDEHDIAQVTLGQQGRVVLAAATDQAVALRVSRITPMAQVREGSNGFEVEAEVINPPSGLRPGLEGVARLEAGSRVLVWQATHRVWTWLRMRWWSLLG